MNQSMLLTVTQAAQELGITRQALLKAARRGDLGQRQAALGTKAGWIYVFTRAELEQWRSRPKRRSGRTHEARPAFVQAAPAGRELLPDTVITLGSDKTHLAHTAILTWCGLEIPPDAQSGHALLPVAPVSCPVCRDRALRRGGVVVVDVVSSNAQPTHNTQQPAVGLMEHAPKPLAPSPNQDARSSKVLQFPNGGKRHWPGNGGKTLCGARWPEGTTWIDPPAPPKPPVNCERCKRDHLT